MIITKEIYKQNELFLSFYCENFSLDFLNEMLQKDTNIYDFKKNMFNVEDFEKNLKMYEKLFCIDPFKVVNKRIQRCNSNIDKKKFIGCRWLDFVYYTRDNLTGVFYVNDEGRYVSNQKIFGIKFENENKLLINFGKSIFKIYSFEKDELIKQKISKHIDFLDDFQHFNQLISINSTIKDVCLNSDTSIIELIDDRTAFNLLN